MCRFGLFSTVHVIIQDSNNFSFFITSFQLELELEKPYSPLIMMKPKCRLSINWGHLRWMLVTINPNINNCCIQHNPETHLCKAPSAWTVHCRISSVLQATLLYKKYESGMEGSLLFCLWAGSRRLNRTESMFVGTGVAGLTQCVTFQLEIK